MTETTSLPRQDVLLAFACDADATGTEPAVVTVQREPGQTLAFCAHHFRQHEVMLDALEWVITDDHRAEIEEKVER